MNKKLTIIFDAYHLYHLPQFDPLIDLLKCDERFEVFLTSSPETEPQEYELTKKILTNRGCKVILPNTTEERITQIKELNPDIYICGWSRFPIQETVPDSTLVGMIYHGIGVKPSYWRDNSSRLNVRFVEGPFRYKQLLEKGIKTDLEIVGFPKIDPLFNGTIKSQKSLLNEMNLDPNKKTILYAPTFYPSSFESFGVRISDLTKDYNLIIKLHQWSYFMKKFSGVNLRRHTKLINRIRKKCPEVAIIRPEHYNIVDLYRAADALLTEASSTIYEMMSERKHIIICDFYKKKIGHHISPKRIYTRRLDQNMHMNMTDFCYHIESPQRLHDTLKKCFDSIDPFKDIREKYIKDMLYKLDGKASERIRDIILDRIENRH